ncbi:dienelactone hydrolase family protein [Nitrosomonas sp.]|uniref:alpha/beta hydrolase n=1 Tax=Nitrosomonas sp. TaxID=42353 RepID=UPI001D937C5B|nr:dienelactone hydrolase family protein [Nitrosomonas sp.]MCB1948500.1 alpha/beta hydrolase fold domain-containing protein [Nitrosomonas sp.]
MPITNLLSTVEIETAPEPVHAVIWMHGLGADGNDFVPIINELKLSPQKGIRFIFPHAPMRPVTINNGYVMRAWYDISGARINSMEDETGIRDAQKAIDALINHEIQRGIAAHKIVLAGFSQGGAIALQTGLRQKNRLAGILALSCYLPLSDYLPVEANVANATIPILMAHGTFDPVVPISLAVASRDSLRQANYALEWHEYPMEHTVCMQEISDIDHWLQRILS